MNIFAKTASRLLPVAAKIVRQSAKTEQTVRNLNLWASSGRPGLNVLSPLHISRSRFSSKGKFIF